jgi:hypothetical protein
MSPLLESCLPLRAQVRAVVLTTGRSTKDTSDYFADRGFARFRSSVLGIALVSPKNHACFVLSSFRRFRWSGPCYSRHFWFAGLMTRVSQNEIQGPGSDRRLRAMSCTPLVWQGPCLIRFITSEDPRSGQTHQRISYDPEALHIAQIPADRTCRSFLFPLIIIDLLGQCIIIQGPETFLRCCRGA